MPNFLNSFKIDDFVDRKNRKNKRLLSECEITELNQLKRGLLAFYIKDKKASYDAYEPVAEKLIPQEKELAKHQAELDKVRTKHLNEMKDAQKEVADIKAKNEAKRMEEEAKIKKEADEKAGSFMDDIFGKVIDLNEKGQDLEERKKPNVIDEDKDGIGEKLMDFWEDVFVNDNNEPVPVPEKEEDKKNEKITQESNAVANIKEEIKPYQKLRDDFIKKGGKLNDRGRIDMDAYIKELNAMSPEEKQKLGHDFMEFLEECANNDKADEWDIDLPMGYDYEVDFMEEIEDEDDDDYDDEDEDEKEKDNAVKEKTAKDIAKEKAANYAKQLVPNLNKRSEYKDDKETFENAANNSEAGEGKLWYALIHQAKIISSREVDYDYFDQKDLDPKEYGLPDDLDVSEEENLVSKDIQNAVNSFEIKDKESALAALTKLAKIKNKIDYEIGQECQRVENILADEDCKDAKADYLVREGQSVPMALKNAYDYIAGEVEKKVKNIIGKTVYLSDGMTMDEYADVMGLSDQERLQYFDQKECNGSDTVKEVFRKSYHTDTIIPLMDAEYSRKMLERLQNEAEIAANTGISQAENNLINRGRIINKTESYAFSDKVWEDSVGDKIIHKGYEAAQAIETFATLSAITATGVELDGKKLAGPKNLFAPKAKSVQKEAKEKNKKAGSLTLDDEKKSGFDLAEQLLDDKYVKDKQDAEEAERIADINNWEKEFKPYENGKWELKNFEPEKVVKIAEDTNIYAAKASKAKITNLAKTLVPGDNRKDLYKGINLADASLTMISTQYMLWLIARKGATVQNVLDAGNNENYKKEFLDFCHNNPNGENGDYFKNANWAKVYRDAFDKIRYYQMPDIDYSDITKVKEHMDEIAVMCAIADNGFKLMDRTFAGDDAKIMAGNEIGHDKFKDIYAFMKGLDVFLRPLNNAYINTPTISSYMKYLQQNVKEIAVDRYIAGKRLDGYTGKPLEDVVRNDAFKNGNQYLNYNDEVFKIKVTNPELYPEVEHISRETALDMLKFPSGFKGRMEKLDSIYVENATTVNNSIYHKNVMDFRNVLNAEKDSRSPYGGMIINLIDISDESVRMNEAIANGGIKGEAYRKWLEAKVSDLQGGLMKKTLKGMGNNKRFTDLFTINGRPFEEYFQEHKHKYEIPEYIKNEKDQKIKEQSLQRFHRDALFLEEQDRPMILRRAIDNPELEIKYNGLDLEMYDFLKDRGYSGKNTADWLNKVTSELLKDGMKETLKKNGLKISDIFLIGGESPKKLYEAKYNFVEDPDEKEQMIQLEIIKDIFKGEKEVTLKEYLIDKNEKLTEAGTIKMFADKDKVEKMIVGSEALDEGLRDIAGQLKKYKEKLIEALPYKEYTYFKIENGRKEEYYRDETEAEKQERFLTAGTGLYKTMAKALDDAIRITEDPNSTPQQVRDALCAFQKRTANYHKERKGLFFGPRSQYGQKRLALAEDARKGTLDLLMTFDNLRRDLHIDHSFGYRNVTTGEASLKDIKDEIKSLDENYRYLYDIKAKERSKDGKDRFNAVKAVSKKQNELLNMLVAENPGHIHMNYRINGLENMVPDKKDQTIEQYAKNYLSKKYLDEMMKKENKPEDVQKLIDQVKDGKLKNEVIKLTNDETFKKIVRDFPDDYYGKMRWEEDIRLGNQRQAAAEEKIKNALGLLGQVHQKGFANSVNKNTFNDDMRYENLTMIVMAQIISSPEYERAIYNKKLGDKDLKQASDYLKKAFKKIDLLRNMNEFEMDIAFTDGQFKQFATDILTNKKKLSEASNEHFGIKEYDFVKNEFPEHEKEYDVQKKKADVKTEKLSNKGAHRRVDGLVLDGNKDKVDAVKAEEKGNNNEIQRSNSFTYKGENKGKVRQRNRSGSVKKNNIHRPGI